MGSCSLEVKEALIKASHKSLMSYFCVPLVATSKWADKDVLRLSRKAIA
jgi:hypothetical protein